MSHSGEFSTALRCLQQLAGRPGRPAASASEIARVECLDRSQVRGHLELLREAGLVEGSAGDSYRLARAPARIRVADVWAALGELPARAPHGRLTLADLLRWESELFAGDCVARAA